MSIKAPGWDIGWILMSVSRLMSGIGTHRLIKSKHYWKGHLLRNPNKQADQRQKVVGKLGLVLAPKDVDL